MVYTTGVQNQNIYNSNSVSFGKKEKEKDKDKNEDIKWVNNAYLMYEENKKHPISTAAKIQADKLTKGFTKYPVKGFKGSKNANFYEFLTMGCVPYLIGSGMLISVFNLASKFFDTPAAVSASKLGKKMGLGVVFYGLGKTFSKKLIETPVNLKYDINVNLPYKKQIQELPEDGNKDNLISYEYHKAYESVDFPRWDLFYDNKNFGEDRNGYFKNVGRKMGIDEKDLENADQKVKPKIKEKVVKTRLFSTLSSYLWAATGVGIAMQKPWETLGSGMPQKTERTLHALKDAIVTKGKRKEILSLAKNGAVNAGKSVLNFGGKFVESTKQFLNNNSKSASIAGRILLGSAIGMTLLGNFSTLVDFNNKGAKTQTSNSLFDEDKEKVVC